METYLKQLVEDICNACRIEDPGDAQTRTEAYEDDLPELFAEVERFIHEDPIQDLSYYSGLRPEQFPPAEDLTQEQIDTVVNAFSEMLQSWNIAADLPDDFPNERKYPLLVSLLNERFHIQNMGTVHWSFCDFDETTCPFGEHCLCKEFNSTIGREEASQKGQPL